MADEEIQGVFGSYPGFSGSLDVTESSESDIETVFGSYPSQYQNPEEEEEPASLDSYREKLDTIVSEPDFFEQPYEEQSSALREIYQGSNWGEDQEDVKELHQELMTNLRSANGKLVFLEEYGEYLPERPNLELAQSTSEAHDMLNDWEDQSKQALKTNLGRDWDDVEYPLTKQLEDDVDGLKRYITAKNYYGSEELRGEKKRPVVKEDLARFAQRIKFTGNFFASLPPESIGRPIQRFISTGIALPDMPYTVDPKNNPEPTYDLPIVGKRTESEILDGVNSLAASLVPAARLAKGAEALKLGSKAGTALVALPLMSMSARLQYQENFQKVYAKTQDLEQAATAGWLAVPGGLLDGAGDTIVGFGAIPPLLTKAGKGLTAKILGKLTAQGFFGKSLRFGLSSTVEGGTEGVQEVLSGEAAVQATGDPSFRAKPEDVAFSTAIGAAGGAFANIAHPGPSKTISETGATTTTSPTDRFVQFMRARDEQKAAAEAEAASETATEQPQPGEESTQVTPEEPQPVVQPETPAEGEIAPEEIPAEEEVTKTKEEVGPKPDETDSFLVHEKTQDIPIEGVEENAPDLGLEQFKEEFKPLQGKFEERGVGPILIWEADVTGGGRRVIATGRHRFELAKRSGQKTIPAQILKESKGWTARRAGLEDVLANIRDQKGSPQDYAKFFKHEDIGERDAKKAGFFNSVEGQRGYLIGRYGMDQLYAAHASKKIGSPEAAAIAKAAPRDAEVQKIGINYYNELAEAGRVVTPEALTTRIRIAQAAKESQGELFGRDVTEEQVTETANLLITEAKSLKEEKKLARAGADYQTRLANVIGPELANLDLSVPENAKQVRDALNQRIKDLSRIGPLVLEELKTRTAQRLAEEKAGRVARKEGEQIELSVAPAQPKETARPGASNPILNRAIEQYGTTSNIEDALYVLPDGQLLAGPAEGHSQVARDASEEARAGRTEDSDLSASIFMEQTKALRITPLKQGIGISIIEEPTRRQKQQIIDAANSRGGELLIDLEDAQANVLHGTTLQNPTTEDFTTWVQGKLQYQASLKTEEQPSLFNAPERLGPLNAPARTRSENLARTQFNQQDLPENAIPEAVNMADIPEGMQRIQPAPIVPDGEPVKPTKDITFDAAKSLGLTIQYKGQSTRAAGTYYPGSAKTSIKYQGDLDVTAHEAAHAFDDKFGIVAEWAGKRKKSPFDDELFPFAEFGSATKSSTLAYRRAEGVAEYIRAWLVNPEAAERAAPRFAKHLQEKVPESALNDLRAFGDDIRKFAGVSAKDRIVSKIRWEPPGAFDKMKSLVTGTKANGFEVSAYDKYAKAILDSLRPYEQAVNFVKKERGIKNLRPSKDPVLLARLYAGMNSKIESAMDKGMFDARTAKHITPGGFSWLLEGLDTSSEKTLTRDAKDVAALAIAERTVEKANQFAEEARQKVLEEIDIDNATPQEIEKNKAKANKAAIRQFNRQDITGISAGLETDYQTARKALEELSIDPRYPALKEGARRYREWSNAGLRYLVDSGRLSEEGYEYIAANNLQYVALNRIRELEPGQDLDSVGINSKTGKIGVAHEPIMKMTGSATDIKNPYIALMESTGNILREADRNRVMQAFVSLLDSHRQMYEGEPKALASVGSRAKSAEPNTIKVWRNGEPEYWRFDKDIYEGLKGLQEASALPAWATILPKIIRQGIIYSPPFMIRNPMRDLGQRLVVTESGFAKGLVETFNLRPELKYDDLKRGGGDQAGPYLSDKVNFARALRAAMKSSELAENSIFLDPRKIAEYIKKYPELARDSELVNRIPELNAAYQKAKAEHPEWSDYDALLYANGKARELMDFQVMGTAIRQINQLVIFTAPAIYGARRVVKAAKTDPMGTAARWTMAVALPTLLLRALNQANGDEDEYKQLPAYQRDLFYNFKLFPNFWARIPKPYELGALASGVERAIDYELGDKKAFEGYIGSLARSWLPVDESAFAGPFRGIVQALANHDFFRDRDVVPFYEENKALELRNADHASRMGKLAQNTFEAFGLGSSGVGKAVGDARIVDFLMRETFGIAGDMATQLSNIGREDTSRKLTAGRLIGLSSGSPVYASRDVQWVYDFADNIGMGSRSKYLENMKDLLDQYHRAKTDKERDKLGDKVRNEAARVRKLFEDMSEGKTIEETKDVLTGSKRRGPKVIIP